MNQKQPEIQLSAFFMVGPTAVGKSRFAQYIAEKKDYAILSADSMSVYKGMDVGTAKPSREDRESVPYGGINLAEAGDSFSVADYRVAAIEFLKVKTAEKIPVMVTGGSGLYIKSLTHGLADSGKPDTVERSRWLSIFEKGGIEALQKELLAVEPDAAVKFKDFANPRRIIRFLERRAGGDEVDRSWDRLPQSVPMAGLDMPVNAFREAVKSRVKRMFDNGLIDECRKLTGCSASLSMTASQAIGYSEAISYIEGNCSLREAMDRTVARTLRLGKKQRTWFRWQAKVEWIEVLPEMETEDIASRVNDVWKKHGPSHVQT